MKSGLCWLLLVCGLILAIPTVIVAIDGPADMRQLTIISIMFYPFSVFGIYISVMHMFWAGARVKGEVIILCKMGIIPMMIIIQRHVVRNIQLQKKIVQSGSGSMRPWGPFTIYTIVLTLRDGKRIHSGELLSLHSDELAKLHSATSFFIDQGTQEKNNRDVQYVYQIIPFMIQIILVVGGIAIYFHLHAMMVL